MKASAFSSIASSRETETKRRTCAAFNVSWLAMRPRDGKEDIRDNSGMGRNYERGNVGENGKSERRLSGW
jgi:hypothetical protein